MKICDEKHAPISYDGNLCPLCFALDTIKEQEAEIESLGVLASLKEEENENK